MAQVTDGIDVTPKSTLSTIQFENEALNTVVTSLLTTLVIANLGSIINRLVMLSRSDVFSYRAFARSYVFLNSDDPLRLWYWFRGCYDFRPANQSPTRYRIFRRHLIAPLFARLCILVVSIGSIALALPSEKRLDGCSGGDYTVVQSPLRRRPDVSPAEVLQVCTEIPLETHLGTVRSSASYCSYPVTPGDIPVLASLSSANEDVQASFVGVSYTNSSGLLLSLIFSGDRIEAIVSFVRWETENGNRYNSLLPLWNDELHLNVIGEALGFSTNQDCNVTSLSSSSDKNDGTTLNVGVVGCAFDASDAIRFVSAAMRESLSFRKEEGVALRAQLRNESTFEVDRMCAVDVAVTLPLINIIPLVIVLASAFCLNVGIMLIVSRHGNAMDSAFHIVREVLGHDTGANPLQVSTTDEGVEAVALKKYVCADDVSCHVGFVQGQGDFPVEEFYGGRNVSRCLQVACRGPRFVSELSDKDGE